MNRAAQSYFTVRGAGGVPLNLREGGNPDGTPIVFLHGLGRCNLDWTPQFESFLADSYRLLAPDLRGHGNSGKPWTQEDYSSSRIWAGDLAAVLSERAVSRPVIVAWSYGGVVVLDYVREHGSDHFRGINFVGNVGLLARGIVPQHLSEAHQSLDLADNIIGNENSVNLLTKIDLGGEWRQQAVLSGMTTPAYVRQAIHVRDNDYSDIVSKIEAPVLVTCGSEDAGYAPDVIEKIIKVIPKAKVSIVPGIGHSPFVEDPNTFNEALDTYVRGLT